MSSTAIRVAVEPRRARRRLVHRDHPARPTVLLTVGRIAARPVVVAGTVRVSRHHDRDAERRSPHDRRRPRGACSDGFRTRARRPALLGEKARHHDRVRYRGSNGPATTVPISPRRTIARVAQTMLSIRRFETESVRLSFAGKIPGGIHSSEGQEGRGRRHASARSARTTWSSGTHRSHHHALAKGMTPRQVMAELYGRADGSSGGRGGSMHLVDRPRNFLGSNGIVGAGLGIAMGAALAMQMQRGSRRRGRILRRRWREQRPHVGVHQPCRALEAAADRHLREQPVRGRDAHLARDGRRVGRRTGRGLRAAR